MTDSTSSASMNQRQEPRYRGQFRQIIWRKPGGTPVPGLLCDFSDSGASFMISQRLVEKIHPGEEIILKHAAPSPEIHIYQVRHVEKIGFGFLLAGCCRATESSELNISPSHPSESAFASPPVPETFIPGPHQQISTPAMS